MPKTKHPILLLFQCEDIIDKKASLTNTSQNMKLLSISAILILSFTACNGNQSANLSDHPIEKSSIITPPFEGDFVNHSIFEIDPAIQHTLKTPNGSSVNIPSNSLVDENGNDITTMVTVSFKQYHSIADIITSGIPMEYDTLGESYSFESAGMFTLDATSASKPVYLKDQSLIEVNLASDKNNEEPFNFYSLNENTGDWTYEHNDTPILNNPLFDAKQYPKRPEPVSDEAFIIDLNFDLSDYEELTAFTGVVWEYTGKADSLDPRKNKWVNKTKWKSFDLKATDEIPYEYFMTMKTAKKSFTTRVKAALDGTDLELAMEQFENKKVENAKKSELLQKPFVRSVNIAGFGTYNYDYIYKIEEPVNVIADFDFNKHNHLKEGAMIVVVYEEDDVIVNYPKSNWELFGLNAQKEAKIIAILPGNQLAVHNGDPTDCYGKKRHTFKMDVLETNVSSKDDIINAIASL